MSNAIMRISFGTFCEETPREIALINQWSNAVNEARCDETQSTLTVAQCSLIKCLQTLDGNDRQTTVLRSIYRASL